MFETSQEVNSQEFQRKIIVNRRVKAEECKSASEVPLYTNKDNIVEVEVLETTFGVLAFPSVIKLYHCGFFNIDHIIQEALLQIRVASRYSCKLFDLSIRKGSKSLFEVRLVMERLEGDLLADIRRCTVLNTTYTETELMNILECVTEALMFAKLRVCST